MSRWKRNKCTFAARFENGELYIHLKLKRMMKLRS